MKYITDELDRPFFVLKKKDTFMSGSSFYSRIVSPFLRRLPLVGTRLDMALIAFHADLQFADSVYSDSGGRIFPMKKLRSSFAAWIPIPSGLPENSCAGSTGVRGTDS